MSKTKQTLAQLLRTFGALMLCLLMVPALVSCGDDEPSSEEPNDEGSEILEMTLVSGTYYDGTDLFETNPNYKGLKIKLEYVKEDDESVYYKYTEMYGSRIDGTGTFIVNETKNKITIDADTYFINDWGSDWNYTINSDGKTLTMSPEGYIKQKFVFNVREL